MNAGQQPPARRRPPAQPEPPRQAPPPPAPPPAAGQVLGAPGRAPNPATTQPVRPAAAAPAVTQPVQGRQVTAASAGLAQPLARPRQAAAPVAPGGPGQSPGGGVPPATREDTNWRTRRHRALQRLRIGRHHAPDEALDRLQLAGSSFGLRLGTDGVGLPVAITLFHPEPWSVVLIGGPWAARLIAFRALRFGARVLIRTNNPGGWSDLGRAATGRTDRVVVLAPGMRTGVTASADTPVLFLWDADSPSAPVEPAAWQTGFTLMRRLTPDRAGAVSHADMVLMQRLTPGEAAIVTPARRLTPRTARQLPMLRDDMMAVLTRAKNHYVWISKDDPAERERVGLPGRY